MALWMVYPISVSVWTTSSSTPDLHSHGPRTSRQRSRSGVVQTRCGESGVILTVLVEVLVVGLPSDTVCPLQL